MSYEDNYDQHRPLGRRAGPSARSGAAHDTIPRRAPRARSAAKLNRRKGRARRFRCGSIVRGRRIGDPRRRRLAAGERHVRFQ
ncbi:MAG: hypothetical protein ACLTMG_07540 [Oscillospiraceae bacterium]